MFVVSVKVSTIKVLAVAAVVAVAIGIAAIWPRGSAQASTVSDRKITGISTNAKRVNFLENYGWKVDPNPIEVVEITIPQTFNEVYSNYNNIQRKQGFDLSDYKGKRCKRWTYRVKNYPGVTGEVRANLIICNDRIVGGDISTVALNGFMHGFSAPEDTDNLQTILPSAANIVSGVTDVTVGSAAAD